MEVKTKTKMPKRKKKQKKKISWLNPIASTEKLKQGIGSNTLQKSRANGASVRCLRFGSRGGPLYFKTKLRPEGPNKTFKTSPNPPYRRVWMTRTPLPRSPSLT